MTEAASMPQTALFRHRPFLCYLATRSGAEISSQVAAVAIGWQVYALTHSALALGMVGLVQFLPTLLLIFVAGHVADHADRRRIVQCCELACAATALLLAWGSFSGWLTQVHLYIAVVVFGTADAFESPAIAALLPAVAPEGQVQRAAAAATGVFQVAMIAGPALGGLAAALATGVPYVLMAACSALAALLSMAIPRVALPASEAVRDRASVFAGVSFVRRHPAILGTISLDLFAVLLGGATALLPIYARDILHTGPWGLGILRSAPAIGALLMSVLLTRHAIARRAGLKMFEAVIVFGVATIVFALSRSLWLSLIALLVLGAADTVSMVIRIALVQLATPDEMRGRVGAVNYLFVNASNQLGQFESGLTAALFGAMPAALIGGVGSVLVALLWMKLFPALRTLERLE
jgi:MFS family permease